MKTLVLFFLLFIFVGKRVLSESCADKSDETKHAYNLSSGKAKIEHYNIVFLGATGNLAAKYLWKSFYELFLRQFSKDAVHFHIYATSRTEPSKARRKISRLLLSLVDCGVETDATDSECVENKKNFVEAIQFHQLKTERDFQELAEKLYENTQSIYGIEPGSPNTYETGRLVYMSIPPSTYAVTAKYIDAYLRPKIGRPWFRVVMEKPFGHDLGSARRLAADVKQFFRETEIYRIDHYLAKTVVKQILPFRYRNHDLYEPFWNRDYIEQIEIVMKEKEDVSGRIDFYDEVGVIRDVMQNHMTELLTLIACDLPADSGNISSLFESKVRLLNSVRALSGRGAVLTGQYSSYNIEWLRNQQRDRSEFVSLGNISKTPTYGAVVLNIDNERWRDVPFVLVSGKKLDEKTSYVRIRFRTNRFCVRAMSKLRDVDDVWCNQRQQLVFRIGNSPSQRSLIAVSNALPKPRPLSPGWTVDSKTQGKLFGQNVSELTRYVAEEESDPYVELIEAVMTGSRHLFVSTDSLLASWKIWTNVLEEASQLEPRQYMGLGKDSERLDLVVAVPGSIPMLKFWVSEHNKPHYDVDPTVSNQIKMLPDTFRNATLISGSEKQVVAKLAEEILRLAVEKAAQNQPFHLAVSGGKTPIVLLHQLSLSPIPWAYVHIWMVDERCDGSNFDSLQVNLLSKITGVRYRNIHPMLLDYLNCDLDTPYRLDKMYETAISRLVPNSSFDLVLLGVGTDGHTASLFPGQPNNVDEDGLVTMVRVGTELKQQRITLTLNAVNRAGRVAVLVTGYEKNEILREISELTGTDSSNRYPITGVNVMNWFIDNDALLGRDGAV